MDSQDGVARAYSSILAQGCEQPFTHCNQEFFLGMKMVVDQSLAYTGLSRDHGHTGAVDRVFGDDIEGGQKNSLSGFHKKVSVIVE